MSPSTTARQARRRIAGLVLGGLLLLLAQSLGLLHGYSHGHGAVAIAAPQEHGADEHAAHAHPAPGLFDGHEDGGAECRIFDQLLHADGLLASAMALAEPPAAALPLPAHRDLRLTARAAGYRARGPPRG